MVVHSDQKKYKCHYCGGQFKRSKALKNHLILHTGLRPYTCPFCDKTFANGKFSKNRHVSSIMIGFVLTDWFDSVSKILSSNNVLLKFNSINLFRIKLS